MKLTQDELDFLSAWAREEWDPECYQQPAHQLQLAHRIAGGRLIDLIKAWTEIGGKKDQEILTAGANATPHWPWATAADFQARWQEARESVRRKTFVP